MARRKKNDLQGFVGAAVLLGAIWLIVKIFEELPEGFGGSLAIFIGISAALGVIVYLFVQLIRDQLALHRRSRIKQSLFDKVHASAQQHLTSLTRR
jgi:hypothetical protein